MTEPTRAFWTDYQPGFRFTTEPPGTPAFFIAVERHRYELEPHVLDVAQFERWRGKDVLEAGCGIGTDGARFARSGARYTGVDQSETALRLARARFAIEAIPGRFERTQIDVLPFEERSFDLVFSHGVIHHMANTEAAVAEFHRVLRPGGQALVMLYHRNSLNYRLSIMLLRRLLAAVLLVPGGVSLVRMLSGERPDVLEGQRRLLQTHGWRYLTDRARFLSNNTDGPGNPLSKVYSRREAERLFSGFDSVTTEVRYLNLRIYPGGTWFARTSVGDRLARRFGWHLYVRATKG
jgi:SAM-dependent methyltransferase